MTEQWRLYAELLRRSARMHDGESLVRQMITQAMSMMADHAEALAMALEMGMSVEDCLAAMSGAEASFKARHGEKDWQ